MSGTKFFIHGGGTWREVDENNGRVSGWGKVQFVYPSRGRLVVARRNSVLRGLKALLAGKPTTVRDGSRLQVIRPKERKRERKIRQIEPTNCNCCTCQHAFHHNHQFATDDLFNQLLKQNTSSTATQCVLTPDSPVKVIQYAHTEQSKKHTEETEKHTETEASGKSTETEESEPVPAKPLETHKVPRKELIIDEDDVVLVRTFIEHDKRNIFDISLVDYDADDNCKRSVFYKINPLVVVEKSSQIAQMIRPPSQCSSVSLQEFIAHLGLRSIHEVSKSSKYRMRQRKSHQSLKVVEINTSDTDKENIKTSTSRTDINNRAEKRLTKTSLLESKHHKIQNKEKTYHDEPLKLKVTSNLRKLSGVRNNNLLNMRRRLRADKNIKINKIETRDSVDGSKKIAEDENILHKSLNSRRHTADKKLLTRSNNRSQSTKVSSDSESLAHKEKNNSVNMSRNLSSVTRDRPTVPIDKKSRATEESTKKSAIDKIKLTKQLPASLPTKTTRNKIPKLPIETSSDEYTFQEDKTKGKAKSKNRINQPDTNSSKQQNSKPEHDRKISQKPNTSSSGGAIRAYSHAEDEAIVSWLKVGDRANLVNGNLIWKELRPEHHKTTGHHRPWQSLRNRYLRYILPALSSLAVSPALAQKLRAAAAKGAIKSRSNSNSANNSIFKSAPVRSAWALRSKSLLSSPPSPPASIHKPSPPTPPTITSQSLRNRTQTATASTSKTAQQPDESESNSSDTSGAYRAPLKRKLRASTVQSPTLPIPKAKDRRDSLTYSELTRRFASRHRSTPHSDSPDATSEQRRRDSSESADSSHQSDSSSDSDDYVQTIRVTRNDSRGSPSLLSGRRRSKRFRSTTPERPKTRRLYNPRAI